MKTLLIFFCFLLLTVDVVLEKRSLLDNKIEMLIPKDFKPMSQELINIKYPGKNRPKLILTDEGGTINIGFSLLDSPADSSVIEIYTENIKSVYKKSSPTSVWKKDGVATINGKKVGYFKFITNAIDQRIYNYVFLTDVHGKLLIGTFNCVETSMSVWESVAEKIVGSLKEIKR